MNQFIKFQQDQLEIVDYKLQKVINPISSKNGRLVQYDQEMIYISVNKSFNFNKFLMNLAIDKQIILASNEIPLVGHLFNKVKLIYKHEVDKNQFYTIELVGTHVKSFY